MMSILRCSMGVLLAGWAAMAQAQAQAPAQAPAPVAAAGSGQTNKANESQAEAVELLRRVIAEQQRNPDKIIRTPSGTAGKAERPTAPRFTRAELERQFVEGKITAKQFQKAMEDLEKNPPPASAGAKTAPAREPAVAAKTGPGPAGVVPMRSVTNQAGVVVLVPALPPEEEPEQKALADVEAKIDEILARRDALQQAAKTNAASTNGAATGPLTKRQKMDALLRQLIQGKITEAEYNAQREKLLALPD